MSFFSSSHSMNQSEANLHLGKKLGVPIYQLLGGKVRHKLKVYAWIGGDRPDEVEQQA